MKIALISTPVIPTPPPRYGGMERSAAWIVEGLTELGHEVTCFCHPDSTVNCHSIVGGDSEDSFVASMTALLAAEASFDVIIDISHDKKATRAFPDFPQINNWQGQVCTWPKNPVFLSRAQAAHVGRPDAPVIYHGPAPIEYPVNLGRQPGGPLLYLGAITKYKSPHLVAEAAALMGREAYIVGPAWDVSYHPRIEEMKQMVNVHVMNDIGGMEKIDLMHSCSVLVHPVGAHGWMEAGALVVLEAHLMGIPVVATPNGCLPEYIKGGQNGYLCDDSVDSIWDAVERIEAVLPTKVLESYDYQRTKHYAAREYSRLAQAVVEGTTW